MLKRRQAHRLLDAQSVGRCLPFAWIWFAPVRRFRILDSMVTGHQRIQIPASGATLPVWVAGLPSEGSRGAASPRASCGRRWRAVLGANLTRRTGWGPVPEGTHILAANNWAWTGPLPTFAPGPKCRIEELGRPWRIYLFMAPRWLGGNRQPGGTPSLRHRRRRHQRCLSSAWERFIANHQQGRRS